MARVYIETTVVSYLVAQPSSDASVRAHQDVTRRWWDAAPEHFDLVISAVTLDEAAWGDPSMASERIDRLRSIAAVPVTAEARDLARLLADARVLPTRALGDALHVATACVNRVEYLVTWNLKHLAGAVIRRRLENWLRDRGYTTQHLQAGGTAQRGR